jgi:hypothetical protein
MLGSAFKSCRKHELLLSVLMAIYIVLNVPTPGIIAPYVDNPLGNIVVVLIALSFFTHSHPVVGVLGLFSAYILIRRSSAATGSYAVEAYVPSERRWRCVLRWLTPRLAVPRLHFIQTRWT